MEIKPIEFRLVGIQILSKNMAEMPPAFDPFTAFNFNLNVESRVQPDQKFVISKLDVIITEVDKPLELFKLSLACIFEVPDFLNSIVPNEANMYVVPLHLENTIRQVAISTIRGVIFSELRGTYLNNAIMPVIFVDSLKLKEEIQSTNK